MLFIVETEESFRKPINRLPKTSLVLIFWMNITAWAHKNNVVTWNDESGGKCGRFFEEHPECGRFYKKI